MSYKSVAQLDMTMGAAEFDMWKAYFEIEPFGQSRDNYHAAMMCAFWGNLQGGKKGRAYREKDFMYTAPDIRRQNNDLEFLTFIEARAKNGK